MPKKYPNHLHKYKRKKLGKDYLVYICIVPGCNHYIPVILAENKLCACNRCGKPMILTKKALTLAKPHCEECTKKTKTSEDLDALTEMFGS